MLSIQSVMNDIKEFIGERPVKEWPFSSGEYTNWCVAEKLDETKPESAALFMELWEPTGQDDGICSKCQRSCMVTISRETEYSPEGRCETSWITSEGSECCGADVVDAAHIEIDLADVAVRRDI